MSSFIKYLDKAKLKINKEYINIICKDDKLKDCIILSNSIIKLLGFQKNDLCYFMLKSRFKKPNDYTSFVVVFL
jgi:hypothetical protein